MDIEYIYRPPSTNVSIEKGFDTIIRCISKEPSVNVSKSFVKRFSFWPFGLIYNMVRYGFKSRKHHIFHITGDVQYIGCFMNPSNTVMTIHDLVPLHNKQVPKYSKWLCYWLWYYFPLKHLRHICCISEETRKDLISFFPWVEHKLTIVPSPVPDIFYYSEKPFNNECPRILHVGTRENKNLPRVIQALKGVSCHLRIIGKLTEEQLSLLKSTEVCYSNDFNISDEQMIEEYKKADIISFPSLFEGFGMPVIEGQVVGRPVVSSNIEPMKSIAGPNAILADPHSVDSIRDCFLTIINNKNKRELSVESGLENAQRFSARCVVDGYLEVYSSIVSLSGRSYE